MSLALGVLSGLSGALLGAWARGRPPPALGEAVPRSSIGDLGPGRFAVRGRVVPIETEPSAIDRARCVYVERVERISGGLGRSLDHAIVAHPFILEDETGRLEVDAARAVVEVSTIFDETGRLAERRLRAGEEIELVCEIRATADALADGATPYRHDVARVVIDYRAAGSPAILRDAIDVTGLELEPRPLGRMAAGAAGAALSAWGILLVLWSFAFAP